MNEIVPAGLHMTPWQSNGIALDHLVVGARSLDEGRRWLEQRLGVEMQAGGQHTGAGTHNCLLNLGGGNYLELIAPDPSQPKPMMPDGQGRMVRRPLPFGLDEPQIQALLAERPRLLHFVMRTPKLEAAMASVDYECGEEVAMSRSDLNWKVGLRKEGMPQLRGGDAQYRHVGPAFVLPVFIDWGNTPHPSSTLELRGVTLQALNIAAPSRFLLRLAGITHDPRIRLVEAECATLAAELQTPNGWLMLD